jgi:hypothetical protein
MKKLLLTVLLGGALSAADAQFQVNPQIGLTYQNMTSPPEGIKYKGAAGWQLGADLRFGDRFYVQPGAFIGRNTTILSTGDSITFEDNIARTNFRLKAMVGYRIIDSYQFDLRFALGPTYDVVMNVNDGDLSFSSDDFNSGSFNIDAALGFDMGLFTLEPSVSFGLSRVFDHDVIVLSDIDSRYITYGLTLGLNIGNDD